MKSILLVGCGGFAGSVARYLATGWLTHPAGSGGFPWGTFAVNIAGCLLIGLLAGLAARSGALSAEARLFLFAGLLGGFTTFSAFGLEAVDLMTSGQAATAGIYVLASVAAGLLAVWVGLWALA